MSGAEQLAQAVLDLRYAVRGAKESESKLLQHTNQFDNTPRWFDTLDTLRSTNRMWETRTIAAAHYMDQLILNQEIRESEARQPKPQEAL